MDRSILTFVSTVVLPFVFEACSRTTEKVPIQDLSGIHQIGSDKIWLTHEHVLVDFIGADSIDRSQWNRDSVIAEIGPLFEEIKELQVDYFVDATPNYLGRDVNLLEKVATLSRISILTNTGLYGARNNRYIPSYAFEMSAEELAEMWINEFDNGIEGTPIRPGFIKIGINLFGKTDV